jgi:hypothetical protein
LEIQNKRQVLKQTFQEKNINLDLGHMSLSKN